MEKEIDKQRRKNKKKRTEFPLQTLKYFPPHSHQTSKSAAMPQDFIVNLDLGLKTETFLILLIGMTLL